MKISPRSIALVVIGAWFAASGCNDGAPYSKAYRIVNRTQVIGGAAALADLGDYILENDRIRIAMPQQGNSVGPGVFGGSLMDADVHRPQARFRGGNGKDGFGELFPIGNLTIPAICLGGDKDKIHDFCPRLPPGLEPSVTILCDGSTACVLDPQKLENADYRDDGKFPSEEAAIIRVQGQAGNYLEALGLVSIAKVKTNFRFRNDYILEPGSSAVRIRTLLFIILPSGTPQAGKVIPLPSLKKSTAMFGLLLGSSYFPTELPDMDPGIAGGDFLFFGARLNIFGEGIGFDIYKEIRNKFATGEDPFNSPIVSKFLGAVGENVSYAIASSDPEGRYLLPLFSGAVTAGFSHGAHCHKGPCPGTPEQCGNVMDCNGVQAVYFERLFAVGDGDIASAAKAIYEAWGTPTGRIAGHVLDRRTGEPVSGAQVYVYDIPKNMADCRPGGSADEPYTLGPQGFAKACLEQRHYMGAVNQLGCDRRATDLPQGAFDGTLPGGRYYLLAKKIYYSASQVVEVEIAEDKTAQLSLLLLPPGRVEYDIVDEQNRHVPAKLTLGQCFPDCSGRYQESCSVDDDCASRKCVDVPGTNGIRRCLLDNCSADRVCDLSKLRCISRKECRIDADCEPVERCLAEPGEDTRRCTCVPLFERHKALGEGSYAPGLGRYQYTLDGHGVLLIEPGAYDIWASRGFEYSVDKQQVALAPGQTALLNFRLNHEVRTPGWISGDFHVHGQNSYDAVVKHRDRVAAFAGEGIELLSSSDHDYITDFAPYVHELGLEQWLATQVGTELTTVELGHFLGFPFRYEEWNDGQRVQEQGSIDWTGKTPDTLFDELRALGEYDPDDTVVVVAHPRDSFFGYFDQYGMSAYDPSQVKGTLFEWPPPLFPPVLQNPLGNPELFSGRFDALEVFNSKRFEMVRTPTAGEERAYNQARSVVELQVDKGAPPDLIERRQIDLDRRYIKEILRRTPAEQDAIWDSDGSEGCDLISFCAKPDDCGSGEICDQDLHVCYTACTSDADCADSACSDGRCESSLGPDDSPCTSREGVIDDWFRLLDYGVVRTAMGNSDTHQLFTQTEAGCPHDFVRSSAGVPRAIDRLEVARNIKAGRVVASYGPFIEAWIDEAEIGQTRTPDPGQKTVALRVKVQSASWYDVDRVEIYRSGRLIHVLTGSGDELDPDSRVDVSGLRLPNTKVVNIEATFREPVPDVDSWYVVIAMGLDGRDMSPVFSEHPYLKLQIGDILSRSFSSVPLPFDISGALIPRVFRVYPYAVTNPVFVDVDGNGSFDAPNPLPGWANGGKKLRSAEFPLSSARIGCSPLAPAAGDRTWRLRQLRYFMGLFHRAALHGP